MVTRVCKNGAVPCINYLLGIPDFPSTLRALQLWILLRSRSKTCGDTHTCLLYTSRCV